MFAIGDKEFPGISKLVEEMGELLQTCGKLMGTGGQAEHWDGSNLHDKFREEYADLVAAIMFLGEHNELLVNMTDDQRKTLDARVEKKLERFKRWHELGLTNLLALVKTNCVVCAKSFEVGSFARREHTRAAVEEAICVGCHEAGK